MDLAEIIARLERGEPPEAIVSRLRPAASRAVLKACAAVRSFGREMYDTLLAGPDAGPDAPSFAELTAMPEVEALPRAAHTFRIRPADRSGYWQAWWADQPDCPEWQLPTALRRLLDRLVERSRRLGEPVDLLGSLAVVTPAEAVELFARSYREADERFDLATCHDLLEALGDPDRIPLFGPELIAMRQDRSVYLAARGLWAAEYLQSGTFLEPAGARAVYQRLVAGDGPRVLQLHAPGGSGKTAELRWLISRQLVPEHREPVGAFGRGRIPCVKIDFDVVDPVTSTKDPWLILVAAAVQLNQQLPLAPCTEFLQRHGWALPLLRRHAADQAQVEVEAAARRLAGQPATHPAEVEREFARVLIETPAAPVLLVLDTLEEVHLRPQGNLRALLELLARLLAQCPTLRLVLSGRYPISEILGSAAEKLPAMAERTLGPLPDPDAGRYLAQLRGISRPEVRDAIVRTAGGDPFKLALLADIAQERPDIDPAEIRDYEADLIYLVQRIVRRITDPQIRWLLRYGVVARRLTPEFVRAVMDPYLRRAMAGDCRYDEPAEDPLPARVGGGPAMFPTDLLPDAGEEIDLDALWARLLRFAGQTAWVSVLPEEPDAVRFHVAVLEPMRRVLRDQDVFHRLHKSAAAYYADLARRDPERRTRWECEAVFHRFQLYGPGAVGYWRELLDHTDIGEPERREALAAEILGPDYLDAAGRPLPWLADRSILTPDTVLQARLERAGALAQLARTAGRSSADQLWNLAEENLETVLRGLREPGRAGIADWRLAYVRAALALRDGDLAGARADLLAALPVADDPKERVRLRLLLADVQLAGGDTGAVPTLGLAVSAMRELPMGARWEPALRRRIVAAHLELDRVAQAGAELRQVQQLGSSDPALWLELQLLGCDVALRSGRVGQAQQLAGEAVRRTGMRPAAGAHRATTAAIRAALAGGDPVAALQLADPAGLAALPDADLPPGAAGRFELAGVAAGALMEFGQALDHLEAASGLWFDQGELEAVARCHTRSALLQIRGIGHLTVAEQHLHEAERLELPVGGEAWLRRASARAELLRRQGMAAEAAAAVRSTIETLRGRWHPARVLVRAAVDGLAFGAAGGQPELLELLLEQIAPITPAAARVTLLTGLTRVNRLDAGPAARLGELLAMLTPPPGDLPGEDRARWLMRTAEAERLHDRPGRAAAQLAEAGPVLAAGNRIGQREWWRAVDRLGPAARDLVAGLDAAVDRFCSAFADFPMLCAAFLLERAEAVRGDGGRAERLRSRAAQQLAAARDIETQWPATQWHARERVLAGELGRDRVAPEVYWVGALGAAGSAFAGLGDQVRAAVTPDVVLPDHTEQPDVRICLVADGDGLAVQVWTGASAAPAERHPASRSPVHRLLEPPVDPATHEPGWHELVHGLCADPAGLAADLGRLLLSGPLPGLLPGAVPATRLRLDIEDRRLGTVPWELATDPWTGRAITEGFAVVHRAVSAAAAERDEIVFLQAGLNRVAGAKLVEDGLLGRHTERELVDFQRTRGLLPDGLVRAEVLQRLQVELAGPARRPTVVLVQPSAAKQVAGLRGPTSAGLHIGKRYQRNGFDVRTVEDPTPADLLRAICGSDRDHPPVIVHLSGGLRESSGGVALSFLAGGWRDPSGPDLPVTALHRLLGSASRAAGRPVVVIDADRPAGATDAIARLLLRNTFAAELFALGGCAAVLATGLAGRDPYQLYEPLTRLLGAGASLGEVATALRAPLPAGGTDLEHVLPHAGVALFTHLPWLRPCPRPHPGAVTM